MARLHLRCFGRLLNGFTRFGRSHSFLQLIPLLSCYEGRLLREREPECFIFESDPLDLYIA